LTPGLHDLTTTREGITCTVVVPEAIAEGKPLPLVVLMCGDGKPDTKAWEGWSAGSGTAVVGINGLTWMVESVDTGGPAIPTGSETLVERTRKGYAAALAAVQQRLPVHPFLRYLVNGRVTSTPQPPVVEGQPRQVTPGAFSQQQVAALLDDREQPFGGVVTFGGFATTRKDVPMLVLSAGSGERAALAPAPQNVIKPEGPVTRTVFLGKYDNAHYVDYLTSGVSMVQDLASITHERLTSPERRDNLETVAARIQEIAGLVNPFARRYYANFLASLPGMDKRRRDYERLMDIWLETSVIIAKEHEKEDLPEAHAYLSVVVRSERFKAAGGKQRKAAQDELARMRKDPVIKREQAAADILADTCAMLEHDASTAKQRIALKDLEAMVAKYPATLAGKEAAKLLETLRQNVR
jgi:hypothetical protein